MKRKVLGRTGLSISALALGTMTFGNEADEAEAGRIYAACREAGIDLFDCANVYVKGRSEEILGRLAAHERDAVILTSKVGFQPGGANRRTIRAEAEASLRRLGTDRIDIHFLHRWEPLAALDEVMEALSRLVEEGKVLWLGISNAAAWQIATANGLAARAGLSRFDVMQPMYNLLKRQAEVELLPMALAEGMGVVPYNPIAGGVLTGKYLAAEREAARLDAMPMYARRYGAPSVAEITAGFVALAEEAGVHPVTLANAWVMRHPAVTAPLLGARNTAQLAPALAAADWTMPDDLFAAVSALSPEPPPATDRTEERG